MTGTAHRKAAALVSGVAGRAAAVVEPVADVAAPSARTWIPADVKLACTDPSWSVRYTAAPAARSLSIVWRVGCPYEFPAPADAIAIRGRTVSTNAWVVAVRLP